MKALVFFAFLVLASLKLAGVLEQSWWWVTSPLWLYAAFAFTGWAMRRSDS